MGTGGLLLGGCGCCAPAWPVPSRVPAPVLVHLVKLLFLVVVEQVANLAVALFPYAPHLAPSVLSCNSGVGTKALHLLLPVFKDRLYLVLLIVGELQRLIQPLEFLIGAHPMSSTHMLAGWAGLRIGLNSTQCHS